MESLFDNLILYEIVLLFLGVFLFIILCCGLVFYIIKKEAIKKLLAFFLIPIVMIAYPSIREVQVGENKIVMYREIEELSKNPNDSIAKVKLKKATEKFEQRATSTEDLIAVSKSYYILGDTKKVDFYTNKALKQEAVNEDVKPVLDKVINDSLIEVQAKRKAEIANIQVLSTLQNEIKKDATLLQDSSRLQEKLKSVNVVKGTQSYKFFSKKYMSKAPAVE